MDKIVINGGKKLEGKVRISGAKNSALPLMAVSLLAPGEYRLREVPLLKDIDTAATLLSQLGVRLERKNHDIIMDSDGLNCFEAPYNLVKTMRASVLVLGPLLARLGKVKVSLPGGCAIGVRPINLHLQGLEALGAKITLQHGYIEAEAKKLKGAKINFDISTVTGTENLLMAASLAEGITILKNAAKEPEVVELANVLNKMGARIRGAGTKTIKIEGVKELKPTDHTIMPDRIEAGTFMIAAAITHGDIMITNCRPVHLDSLITTLKKTGVDIIPENTGIRVKGSKKIKSVNIKTSPYPGFPTDMQAQIMTLMTVADKESLITETVFENRFMHISELRRMGANIRVNGHKALVTGVPWLEGAPLMATDLRASASLILAGLKAEGSTEVSRVYHLDRGYENIENKLSNLGAEIKRITEYT